MLHTPHLEQTAKVVQNTPNKDTKQKKSPIPKHTRKREVLGLKMIRTELMHIVYEHQKTTNDHKEVTDLMNMSQKELQEVEINLNPHELIEQIHYILKTKTIKYSIRKQQDRKKQKANTEAVITGLHEKLNSNTLNQEELNEAKKKLLEKEIKMEQLEEHLAKGTSIRSRQEWDINAEKTGKILLKCEDKYGQQKYMQSIVLKKTKGGK